jgi:hypothetical protein
MKWFSKKRPPTNLSVACGGSVQLSGLKWEMHTNKKVTSADLLMISRMLQQAAAALGADPTLIEKGFKAEVPE